MAKIRELAFALLFVWPTAVAAQPALGDLTVRQALQDTMTVRELFAILNEREKASNQRFDAQERATANALAALEKTTANTLVALDRNNAAALTAAKEAVTKAEIAAEKRFDSVNEFRNTLKDQQATLISKTEADTKFKFIEERLKEVEARLNKTSGSFETANWIWVAMLALLGLLLAGFSAWRHGGPRVAAKS